LREAWTETWSRNRFGVLMALPPRPVPNAAPHPPPSLAPCSLLLSESLLESTVDAELAAAHETGERPRLDVAKEYIVQEKSVDDGCAPARHEATGARSGERRFNGESESRATHNVSGVDRDGEQDAPERRRSASRSCRISGRDRRAMCLAVFKLDVCAKGEQSAMVRLSPRATSESRNFRIPASKAGGGTMMRTGWGRRR